MPVIAVNSSNAISRPIQLPSIHQGQLKYPPSAQRGNIEGKVFVKFIVDKNGKIINAEILKGFHEECDVAALNVISNSPDEIPDFVSGQLVKLKMIFPVTFILN